MQKPILEEAARRLSMSCKAVRTNFCETGPLPLDTTYRKDIRVEHYVLERIENHIFTGVQNALDLRHAVPRLHLH